MPAETPVTNPDGSTREFVYIICPVREVTPEQLDEMRAYVTELRKTCDVLFPPDDTDQVDDTGGVRIVREHGDEVIRADRVEVFWHPDSKGSYFDFGMAYVLDKPMKLIKEFVPDGPGKSYAKVLKEMDARFRRSRPRET